MRRLHISTAIALVLAAPAMAQPKAAAPAARPATSGNPVVATVNGDPIRMSDVAAAAQQLPPQIQQSVPPDVLYGKLVDQLVSRKALLIQARRQNLQADPQVQKQIQDATDQVLTSNYLRRTVMPMVTEEAIKAQYDKQYAGKPGEQEVHARHILVDSQAKAQAIIAQLDKGAKFEDLAKKYGDPKDASTQQGGDLGFFKKGDMLPEFSAVAFSLKPGQYTKTPVHTRYGWHVIEVVETRTSQPPAYDAVHDEIKQQLLQKDVQAVVAQAKQGVKVQILAQNLPGARPAAPAPATK